LDSNERIDKNRRNAALSDVKKLKASIVELQGISEQASQLTHELVCCRQELIQLRKTIKNKEDDHNKTKTYDTNIEKIKIISINENLNNHCLNNGLNGLNDKQKLIVNNNNCHDVSGKQIPSNNQIVKQNKDLETIRKLNCELKEAQSNYDFLEIAYERLTKKIIEMERTHESDLNLMKDRINDLTQKLLTSEQLLRLAKQKISKYESRHERRRSSLKGKVAVCADI
jgi:hypothetical protein